MITDHPHFYLPNLYTFQNKNTFYGSLDELRFRVAYGEEEESGIAQLQVCTWTGEYCLAESKVEAEAAFPLDPEGYQALLEWLGNAYRQVHPSTAAPLTTS